MSIDAPPHVDWPDGAIASAAAAGDYVGTLRQIIHAFKYDARRSLASQLAELMRLHGADVLAGASCVIPVPLHPLRQARRGFNQAMDLASGLGLPVTPVLWRRRMTAFQADLGAADRRRNVHGAFSVSPLASRRMRESLRGQTVVLVDDVRTTGATLHACADVLLAAGVREVRGLTTAVRAFEPST